MMCALIEDLLPPSYFSSTLLGVQTDQRVLRQLIVQYLPALDRLLQEHDIGRIKKDDESLVLECGKGVVSCTLYCTLYTVGNIIFFSFFF